MPNISKPIPPTDSVKNYLDETFELAKIRKLGKKTFDGSSIGSKELAERLEELAKINLRIRNNREAKVRAIDNLFESMANLIYFFEFVNIHPELMDRFDDDIQDLLGLKGAGPRNPKGEGLIRLLHAVLSEGSMDEDIKFNYRRRMVKVIQFLANQKAKSIVMTSKKDPLTYADPQFSKMIFSDLDRAQVWMNYLDRLTTFETKKPSRVLGLD